MLEYILADYIESPWYNILLDSVYYAIIFLSLAVGFYLFYRRLIILGYDKRMVKIFSLLALLVSYPLGIISARAVSIFYFPTHLWSINFFIDQLIYGKNVTAHGAPVLPIIVISLFIVFIKFKFFEVWDTIFLYIPLVHAIGRVACLLVGCCWGNPVSCSLFGHTYEFDNPVPLYAIIYNTAIFLCLRSCYNRIYAFDKKRDYSGLIISLYLLIYGNIRLIVEIYRKTPIVSWGLTQAQIAMIFFIAIGSVIFFAIILKSLLQKEIKGKAKKEYYHYLFGVFIYFLIVVSVYVYLSDKQIIRWPFHTVNDISEAYQTILEYFPALMIALLSLIWLKLADIPIAESFRWKRTSKIFYVVLTACIAYSVYILKPIRFGIHVYFIWPPVLILSALNALTEEIIFRLVFFSLLRKATGNSLVSNIIQSTAYAVMHAFIGGPVFAVQAFVLGMALGFIMEKEKSLIPCLICHFCVDLGAIGYPILSS